MDKVKTYLELGSLEIVDGDSKRKLENYVNPQFFRQRKTYDEYYIDVTNVEIDLDFNDLTILAEDFIVKVLHDGHVVLSD